MNSNNHIQVSRQTARRFLLTHQFLYPSNQLKGKAGIKKIFDHLGCIQYDTINVVGRNADLVLQSRIQGYRPEMLEELLYKDRYLLDGWDKQASLIKTTDWPHFSRRREILKNHPRLNNSQVLSFEPRVLARLKNEGPLSSIDFKSDDNTVIDWSWAPTKLARATLEALDGKGIIGVDHKINTRRIFDLIERLIPAEILNAPDPHPTDESYEDWHLLRRLGSMGLATSRSGEYWFGIPPLQKAKDRNVALARLVENGEVLILDVEGVKDPLYMRTSDEKTLKRAEKTKGIDPTAAFIAPLDHLIWIRKLISDLFDFDYIWEVYKPAKIREYGYYTLPVLCGDQFVARMDAKLDRKTNILTLNGWWWEPEIDQNDEGIRHALKARMIEFMAYLGTDQIQFGDQVKPKDKKLFK